MSDLSKRLEIIRNAIALGDEDIIALQAQRLPAEAAALAAHLRQKEYGDAAAWIKTYHSENQSPALYQDPEIAALLLELEALENEVTRLIAEKADMEGRIAEFNAAYMEAVGDVLERLLQTIQTRAEEQAQAPAADQAQEEARRARTEYENFKQQRAEQPPVQHLDDAQKDEMRRLYRKAAQQCHPDRLPPDKQKAGTELFQQLEEAYRRQDIERVKTIWQQVEHGDWRAASAALAQQGDAAALRARAAQTRRTVDALREDIAAIRADEVWQQIEQLAEEVEWAEYFADIRAEMEQKLEEVENSKEDMQNLPAVTGGGMVLSRAHALRRAADYALSFKTALAEDDAWVKELVAWAKENDIDEWRLPRDKEGLLNLQGLYFRGNQLSSLPESIGSLQNLRELNLSGNQLSSLPESIGSLQKLQVLDLRGCRLSSLPESVSSLQNLQVLYLKGNHLSLLPESIGSLQNLQVLYLKGNHLSLLPESIGSLQKLQVLDLRGCRLSSLPESVGSLQKLRGLDLSGNQLSSLPESAGRLQNLRELNLSSNQLSSLPESASRLQNLRELNLSGNQLSSLPESVRKLQKLRGLDLSGNQLSFLPESAGKLQNLRVLDLERNQLLALPESMVNLQNLQELDVRGNPLSSIPDSIRRLPDLTIYE